MINSLKGVLTEKSTGKFFLECSGLEWEIETSYATLSALPAIGKSIRVFTYLYHREDSMRLFGFADKEERALFLDLLKVNGVGAKQSLRILSGTTVQSFARILDSGDAVSLARIPGLGIKTAQKIILALKGKLSLQEDGETSELSDIVLALDGMGFDKKKAVSVVTALTAELEKNGLNDSELEKEIFRQAIIRLSGKT